jgi:nitrate/nitrite transport system substrate-binding protein
MSNQKKIDAAAKTGATRREFLATAGGALLAVSAAQLADLGALFRMPGAHAAEFKGTKNVSVGIMTPSHCAAPYVYSDIKGLYEKNGLKADVVLYPGMPEIAKDLIAGRIQFGQLMLPLFLAIHTKAGAFKESGVPLVTTQATGIKGGAITVRKDSGIESVEDLAGKKVGSHSPLSAHYLLLQMFIKKNIALKAPIDVKIVPLEDMIPSLTRGDIDAFIMPEPVNAVAAIKGNGKVIFMTSKLWANHPCCMLSTTGAFAGSNPGTVRAMSLALAEAGLFAEKAENRAAFIDTIATSPGYAKVPRPVLNLALEAGRADFSPFPYKSSARVVGDFMKTLKMLPESVTPAQIVAGVDSTYVREALKAAGLDAGLPDYRVERVLGEDMKFED